MKPTHRLRTEPEEREVVAMQVPEDWRVEVRLALPTDLGPRTWWRVEAGDWIVQVGSTLTRMSVEESDRLTPIAPAPGNARRLREALEQCKRVLDQHYPDAPRGAGYWQNVSDVRENARRVLAETPEAECEECAVTRIQAGDMVADANRRAEAAESERDEAVARAEKAENAVRKITSLARATCEAGHEARAEIDGDEAGRIADLLRGEG